MPDISKTVRVLIIGSHKLHAHARRRLMVDPAFEVVQSQHNGHVIAILQQNAPHIMLLDVVTNKLRQQRMTHAVAELEFPPSLVAVSPVYEPFLSAIDPAVFSGSLLTRLVDSTLLPHVLSGVVDGYTYFVPPPAIASDYRLEEDELRVLRLLAMGLDTTYLIEMLGHTRDGIYYIRRKIRQKLGARTIQQAVVFAIQNGIVATLTRPEVERIA